MQNISVMCSDGRERMFRQIILDNGRVVYRDNKGRSPQSFTKVKASAVVTDFSSDKWVGIVDRFDHAGVGRARSTEE